MEERGMARAVRKTGIELGLYIAGLIWSHPLAARTRGGMVAVTGLALAISAFLIRWMMRAENRLTAYALGAVVGGAVGNVIDRLRFGGVADFLDAHGWGWHWYVFNLADAAIVLGVLALVGDALFRPSPKAKGAAP
jgi:lipoprotein signal peptidase